MTNLGQMLHHVEEETPIHKEEGKGNKMDEVMIGGGITGISNDSREAWQEHEEASAFKQAAMASIRDTLNERGSRYGEFPEHARITQAIKSAMVDSPNWQSLRPDMKEALEMTAHKIGRILNGDPNWHDSWHDIEGYAHLISETLVPKQ